MSMSSGRNNNTVRANSTDDKHVEPRTILSMSKMEMFALEVGDEKGERTPVVAFRLNGVWYHDPVGKEWLARLRPLKANDWLAKEAESRFTGATAPVSVPKNDHVDIMGAQAKVKA